MSIHCQTVSLYVIAREFENSILGENLSIWVYFLRIIGTCIEFENSILGENLSIICQILFIRATV